MIEAQKDSHVESHILHGLQKIGEKRKSAVKSSERPSKSHRSHSTTKAKGKSGGKKSQKARPAKKSGVPGIGAQAEIVNYDPIVAYQDQWEEAPSIEATTKKKQLEAMLAGCPEGSHMPQNQRDRAAIDRATKSVPGRRVTAFNGDWKFEGMKAGELFCSS